MNFAVTLVTILALAAVNSATESRRYDSKEENPLRIRYLPRLDEDGNLYYEDLVQEAPSSKTTTSDVKIYIYTPSNPEMHQSLGSDEASALSSTNFDPSLPVFVVTHGWNNYYESDVNLHIRGAILSVTKANVFVVDWSSITNGLYTTSYWQVRSVGEIVGDFIYSVMNTYNISASNFHLVGHSLGAHVSGCAGARVRVLSGNQVASIVGLDPAGPRFTIGNTNNRLDPTDASFVQVIHTNGGFLGFSSAIGDADYYPNGGSIQNGCGLDLFGTCAHGRAYLYYAESILSSGFNSHYCNNYSSYGNGNCNSNHRSFMGELYVDSSASGDYYLNTNSNSPYAKS